MERPRSNQATIGANWAVIQVNIDGAVTITGSQALAHKTLTAPVIDGTETGTAVRSVETGGIGVAAIQPFRAAVSANQTAVVTATFTKVNLNTESFDSESAYDNLTNIDFLPFRGSTRLISNARC